MTGSNQEERPARRRRSFTAEFKADAVALVLIEGRPVVDVSRSLGIGAGTLGNWVRQDRIDRGDKAGVTTSERGADASSGPLGCVSPDPVSRADALGD